MTVAMRTLLDVNVWIALFDGAHQFAARANAFVDTAGLQIASCPIVENGVIRVLSSPHYSRHASLTIQQVREQLRRVYGELDCAFWADDVSLRDESLFNFSRVQGHNQITDLYLLGLAVRHGGRLASFDQGIAISSVHGAGPEHLLLL
jgi:toxin-antitoxin system PIN domain toxin